MFNPRPLLLVPLLALVGGALPLTAATPATPAAATPSVSADLPKPADVLEKARLANAWFMKAWPDPGKIAPGNHPSNIWTRGVYYEGLMSLYRVDPDKKFLDYAVQWADFHKWSPRAGARGNADNQCCGQTFLDLYQLDPQPVRLAAIKANLDGMLATPTSDDWTWVDAIQMSMPVFAKLGVITKDPKYFEKMHALFVSARDKQGFYNKADGLWWRDKNFAPPHVTPNGKQSYWSRGNGWVITAMARVLDVIPADAPHREEYVKMLQDMAAALKKVQRPDGFWNPSLADPADFGGKETSGTALFTFAMAWGVNHQVLPREEYLPVVARAWNALATEALHPTDGFLGFVQGTGKQPSEGQPVTYDHKPDFDDFGTGCFLLAGSEVFKLAGGQVPPPAAITKP